EQPARALHRRVDGQVRRRRGAPPGATRAAPAGLGRGGTGSAVGGAEGGAAGTGPRLAHGISRSQGWWGSGPPRRRTGSNRFDPATSGHGRNDSGDASSVRVRWRRRQRLSGTVTPLTPEPESGGPPVSHR